MRKKSKRSRKIQKEKEVRIKTQEERALKTKNEITEEWIKEVTDIKIRNLCMANIIMANPVVYDTEDTKKEYLERINKYLKIGGWRQRKYEASEYESYQKNILECKEIKYSKGIDYYMYYIVFDLIHILGYDTKEISQTKLENVRRQYLLDFASANLYIFTKIIKSVQGEEILLENLKKNSELKREKHYIELIRKNLLFRKKEPFNIIVTATMSAGKSTFINAIAGKYVCLSQNMACTSKIHSVINKAFEDKSSFIYDHDLIMAAGKEDLLENSDKNLSDKIYVATRYHGSLANERIIINDSPGVNFSGNQEHKKVANQLIKRRNYNLLIYVMNATQLGTNDESEHLEFIKKTIGKTPIIFVMNKVDTFNPEEENIEDIIIRQKNYLKGKGFQNPIICPVSARAGYLVKKYEQGELLRNEKRELYNYVDKFEKMNLKKYYAETFKQIQIKNILKEEEQLLKTSGILFVEKLIKEYAQGGR